jgi:hypothetical protein
MRKNYFILFFMLAFANVFAQTANVFWSVNQDGSPMSFPVATADITMTDGVNAPITLAYDSVGFMDTMFDVPYGTYNYTITTEGCRITTGQVTVNDTTLDPNNPTPTVAVFVAQGDAVANVFWSVNQDSSPMSFPVATANITMTDGVNAPITLAYDSNNFMDAMVDVPFGTYDYTISIDCRADVTGQVTVDCSNIDPNNPTPTVAVFTVQGAEITTANVFWSVNQDGSPMSFPVATADITMTDGVNAPITLAYDSNNFMDAMVDVPYGTYDYTITTEGCRVRTGQVVVNCANTDPNNPTPTVAVFVAQGDAVANVFWSVNQDSSPMSFPVATANITMTDGVNAPITLAYDSNNFMDAMVDVPFGTYDYTISIDCRADVTGQVTVDCSNIDPNNPTPTVAVFTVQGAEITTANVFWSVNQDGSPMSFPVATADITMTDGVNAPITLAYDSNNFMDAMVDVPYGTYDYTITTEGCRVRTGQVVVNCANTDPNNPTPTVAVFVAQGDAVANVFWSVNQDSSPMSFPVATANITMTDGVNAPITLAYDSNNFMDAMVDVPFGTYDYTISIDCRADVTGQVTVDCSNIDPNNPTPTVAVFTVQGAEITTANVFWSVNQDGSPMSFPVATADITMTDGVNAPITLAYDSNNFMDAMVDVPYGTYDYTITTEGCRVRTGQVVVNCANTDPNNPTPTVAVFVAQGDAVANVFWSVNQDSSPMSFPVATANITMTDGVNAPITLAYDSNNFMDAMVDVPFGTYDYTISIDCRADVTGQVTVDCSNIDPNNPTPTVAVFTVQGSAVIIDTAVTQNGEVLTASTVGPTISYQWVDCNNGDAPVVGETNQEFTATSNGSYAVIITDSACTISEKSSCYDVNSLGIDDNTNPLSLKLFPNPVVNELTIKLNSSYEKIDIQVYSILGKLVKSTIISKSQGYKFNLSDLSAGTYVIKINADGKIDSSLIIKK